MAIANGHRYTQNSVSKIDPNLLFYHCIEKQKLGCPGIIHIIDQSYNEVSEHCHESVSHQALVNAIKCKETVRVGAPMVGDDISTLVNDAYDVLHSDEKALLKKKSSIHRMARDIKNKGPVTKLPAEPDDSKDLGKLMHFCSSLSPCMEVFKRYRNC